MSTSESLLRSAHNWAQAPLSPPSPTSSANASTSVNSKRALVQPNLPSSPAPSHSSVDASPRLDSLTISGPTPPASVPMSAQQSQTSTTDAPPYSPPAEQNNQLHAAQPNYQHSHFENQLRAVSGSKRKVEDDAEGETPSKRVRTTDPTQDDVPETSSLGQQALGISPLFKLDSQPVPRSRPHASQNLIELYGLDDVASSVARKDANGTKINKLRKSYENYLKDLPGRDKKREQNFELRNLASYPEEEYHIQQVSGRELSKGLTDSLLAKLAKATQMGPGKLPEADDKKWRSIVDVDGPKPQPLQWSNSSSGNKRASDAAPPYAATSPTTSEPSRTSRRGVKRRYNDESFEGYAESFAEEGHDTHAVDNGEDGGEAGAHGKRKQRRRDTASSPKYPEFGPNGLNNAVSVGGYSGR